MFVHVGPRIIVRLEASGETGDRQLVRVDLVDLLPMQRRGHLGTLSCSNRPRAEHGLVWRVLVEVDEYSRSALLLPPRRGHSVGVAPLELARDGDGSGPYLVRVPPRLETNVHV